MPAASAGKAWLSRPLPSRLSARSQWKTTETWAGESWPDLRAKLLERLAQASHASDRVRIYLSEAMIDEAVACVGEKETFGIGDTTLMQLADAAHASHSA